MGLKGPFGYAIQLIALSGCLCVFPSSVRVLVGEDARRRRLSFFRARARVRHGGEIEETAGNSLVSDCSRERGIGSRDRDAAICILGRTMRKSQRPGRNVRSRVRIGGTDGYHPELWFFLSFQSVHRSDARAA